MKINLASILLFIPLRLGLSETQFHLLPIKLRDFPLPQSWEYWRPSEHALYSWNSWGAAHLFGSHKTQNMVDLDDPAIPLDDSSYHYQDHIQRMDLRNVGSVAALCFFCKTEEEFDSWCNFTKKCLLIRKISLSLNSPLQTCSLATLEQENDVFDERLQQQVQMPHGTWRSQDRLRRSNRFWSWSDTTIFEFLDDHWFVHKLINTQFLLSTYNHCLTKNTKFVFFCVNKNLHRTKIWFMTFKK